MPKNSSASRTPRWLEVSSPETPNPIYPDTFLRKARRKLGSPIDEYYLLAQELVLTGTDDQLTRHPGLGRLILLGLVAGVDTYFHRIIAGAVRVCPLCWDRAASHQVALGALEYYGPDDISLGLVEQSSFATRGEVLKWSKKLLNMTWERSDSLGVAMDTFGQVCEMRHAAVHAGILSSGSARTLGTSTGHRHELALEWQQIQDTAGACHTVVRAYNRALLRGIVHSWVAQHLLTGDWKVDKPLVDPLFKLFHAKQDPHGIVSSYAFFQHLHSMID